VVSATSHRLDPQKRPSRGAQHALEVNRRPLRIEGGSKDQGAGQERGEPASGASVSRRAPALRPGVADQLVGVRVRITVYETWGARKPLTGDELMR
jgi:hypothetical protein